MSLEYISVYDCTIQCNENSGLESEIQKPLSSASDLLDEDNDSRNKFHISHTSVKFNFTHGHRLLEIAFQTQIQEFLQHVPVSLSSSSSSSSSSPPTYRTILCALVFPKEGSLLASSSFSSSNLDRYFVYFPPLPLDKMN